MNDVFRLLKQSRFDPSEFEWQEADVVEQRNKLFISAHVSTLVHSPTNFSCRFGPVLIRLSPGPELRVENHFHRNEWDVKLRLVETWLSELRKEVDAPDLWATIGQEKALSTAASSVNLDNRPFTAPEQRLIATKLDEIKAYLLEGQEFAAEQGAAIDREFAYLKEAAERMGRKDWLNILLGGLFGLAVTLALEPEKARDIMRLAGTVFQSLWGMAQRVIE
jgi:hypothetical protein